MLRLVDAQPSLGNPNGTFKFLCMRGTEFKPLYHVYFFDFLGLNVRLNNVKFFESFLKAVVADFGLKVHISNVSHSSRQ